VNYSRTEKASAQTNVKAADQEDSMRGSWFDYFDPRLSGTLGRGYPTFAVTAVTIA